MSTDTRECAHAVVTGTVLSDTAVWVCVACETPFLPAQVVQTVVDQRMDEVVAIASGILWNFHERALAEGLSPSTFEVLEPQDDDSGQFEHTPQTCPKHEYNGGQCMHCGASQFLGSE